MELGKYRIVRKLATGGMAEIFLARHKVGGEERELVIKKILPEHADDPKFIQSFLDEAKLAGQLRHPNIVQIYDLGKIGKSFFIAMEYIRGYDVATLLHFCRAHGTFLPIGVALQIFCDLCAGLDYAHAAVDIDGKPLGVVHRDVTPSNVIVSMEGPAKIVDFGIAKASTRSEGKTKTGTIKGKFSHLSPEQVLGTPVDNRSDVFAAGILLQELLTNDNPFRAETDYLSLQRIVSLEVPAVSALRPEVPVAFDAIVGHALRRDANERYPTCGDFLRAVTAEAQAHGIAMSHDNVRVLLTNNEAELAVSREQMINEEDSDVVAATDFGRDVKDHGRPNRSYLVPAAVFVALLLVGMLVLRLRQTPPALPAVADSSAIEVVSDPPGAQVVLDGVLMTGETPLRLADVQVGATYRVDVIKKGLRPAHTEVTLDSPGLRKVQIALAEARAPVVVPPPTPQNEGKPFRRPEPPAPVATLPPPSTPTAPPPPAGPGTLRVTVVPWGTVTIDGKKIGETPFPPCELPAGDHVVLIENPELGKRVTRKVNVAPGKESSVLAELTKD